MMIWALLPIFTFLVLLSLERQFPASSNKLVYKASDWIMNLSGFFMQGVVVPLSGYVLATQALPHLLPAVQGCLPFGFTGAFFLNIVGVDFLYYVQHKAFHKIPWLWKLHAPHHYSPTLNVWATSRNALLTHFLFVYMLANPLLAYLCNSPEGFFAGAMVTAALDLFRHANIRLSIPILQGLLLMPQDHHRHHNADKPDANYGANFIVWDRLFGTFDSENEFPRSYSMPEPPPFTMQLFYPWRS